MFLCPVLHYTYVIHPCGTPHTLVPCPTLPTLLCHAPHPHTLLSRPMLPHPCVTPHAPTPLCHAPRPHILVSRPMLPHPCYAPRPHTLVSRPTSPHPCATPHAPCPCVCPTLVPCPHPCVTHHGPTLVSRTMPHAPTPLRPNAMLLHIAVQN